MSGLLLVLALLGCGKEEPLCPDDAAILASADGQELSCGTADAANDYIRVLSARAVSKSDRERVYAALKARFEADASGTLADLAAARSEADGLAAAKGLDAAERRASLVYQAFKRQGPLMGTDDVIVSTMARTAQLWASDDETQLAMTELDVEGWLKYASLCREVQGGGPLKLSIADRVPAYQVVEDLFKAGPREQQIALAAMGPFWPHVKAQWAAASYEQQQAWIQAAPLPPPMTASSLGYFEAVLAESPASHAALLHDKIGPFQIRDAE
ncbi:MAG: hypothetical protein EP330_24530 [Deltaproteobacteria bacterium]|nr:MAG: hypothetical protein EP330_24530 [Deltaproteobacteria bacterium]